MRNSRFSRRAALKLASAFVAFPAAGMTQTLTVPRDTTLESDVTHRFGGTSIGHRDLGSFMAAARLTGEPLDRLLAWSHFLSDLSPVPLANEANSQGYFMFPASSWLKLHEMNSVTQAGSEEMSRERILERRFDPFFASVLMVENADRNAEAIGSSLPDRDHLITAHLFGASITRKYLSDAKEFPIAPASFVFSENQMSNRMIFYRADGNERQLGELRQFFSSEIATRRSRFAQAETSFVEAETRIQVSARKG